MGQGHSGDDSFALCLEPFIHNSGIHMRLTVELIIERIDPNVQGE
jgi:hypothetical protein